MSFRSAFVAALLAACSHNAPQAAVPENSPTSTTDQGANSLPSTQPDAAKLRQHFARHVNYPASREQVLQACANTPEFTDAEKRWTSDHLPARQYQDASQVVDALGLEAS